MSLPRSCQAHHALGWRHARGTTRGTTILAALVAAYLAVCVSLAVGVSAAPAAVYPAGRGDFDGGPEGWVTTEASCNVPALCSASGGYDATHGRPPGSIEVRTNIALNLLSLFRSTVTLQSPDFEVGGAGPATLHLDRQFSTGSLVDLAPTAAYTVTLIDRDSGARSELLSESLDSGDSGFLGKDAAASVKAGHTYAISIETVTESTVVGTGLLSGTTDARFDNVSLTVNNGGGGNQGAGGKGKGGSNGSGGSLSDSRLSELLRENGAAGVAVLVGGGNGSGARQLLVRVKCPRQVGHACRIGVQGMLSKRKAATGRRAIKVRPGKVRLAKLRVKPRATGKVSKRKRLLVREKVHAGKAKATVFRLRKLIRR
jgi:hypothetical protein